MIFECTLIGYCCSASILDLPDWHIIYTNANDLPSHLFYWIGTQFVALYAVHLLWLFLRELVCDQTKKGSRVECKCRTFEFAFFHCFPQHRVTIVNQVWQSWCEKWVKHGNASECTKKVLNLFFQATSMNDHGDDMKLFSLCQSAAVLVAENRSCPKFIMRWNCMMHLRLVTNKNKRQWWSTFFEIKFSSFAARWVHGATVSSVDKFCHLDKNDMLNLSAHTLWVNLLFCSIYPLKLWFGWHNSTRTVMATGYMASNYRFIFFDMFFLFTCCVQQFASCIFVDV